ncbi:MAG: 50S ribosomal protein L6 [Planctomycetota bacterium]
MSRIGRQPIKVPSSVKVSADGGEVKVKGPKGELAITLRPEVEVKLEDGRVTVDRLGDERDRLARAFHGMTRALLNNMVIGVSEGYKRTLLINGVGYTAKVEGQSVVMNLGFAHSVTHAVPAGLTVTCPNQTTITIEGCDKQAVGQLAASIRKLRPPEPYNGKGIKYDDEIIRRKAGKAFGSA